MGKSNDKTEKENSPNTLMVTDDDAERAYLLAQSVLRPSLQAARTLQSWKPVSGDVELGALMAELCVQSQLVSSGNLGRAEAMLIDQAHTLDAIFNNLARRAANAEYIPQLESYLRLGLKAQSQCRSTLESLALIKIPPLTTFVKQANIANNQQVNNGPAHLAREGETKCEPNKLLETDHGERLDTGATGKTIGGDSQLETVATVNRAANCVR